MERTTSTGGAAARARRAMLTGVLVSLGLLGTGCSLDDLVTADQLPPDVTPPAITRFALRVTAVRCFGATMCVSLVPGPMTHWS